MSHTTILNSTAITASQYPPAGTDTVNRALTPKRARAVVENDAYAAFAHRILAACAGTLGAPRIAGRTAVSAARASAARVMPNGGSPSSARSMAQGDWADPALGRITFGDYAQAWLGSRADLKPKTRHQYRWLMQQHILPTWRTVPLAKVTFEGLTEWVAKLTVAGLGPSAIRQSVFVVSAALDHAVRSGRIRANPAHGLGLPRPKRRDYVYLTHSQALKLATEAGPWRLLILLLAYTGLRWGEATALRACDIDLGRRRIDVQRAFSDVGGHVVLGTPKSHQSRTVPVPQFIAAELAAAITGRRPDDLVFTMPGGSVVRLRTGAVLSSCPPAPGPGSTTGSAFTTSGTRPPR